MFFLNGFYNDITAILLILGNLAVIFILFSLQLSRLSLF